MLAQPDSIRHLKAFSGVKLLSPEMRGTEKANQESRESTGLEVSHGNLLEGPPILLLIVGEKSP
jgi:hypothetical protein